MAAGGTTTSQPSHKQLSSHAHHFSANGASKSPAQSIFHVDLPPSANHGDGASSVSTTEADEVPDTLLSPCLEEVQKFLSLLSQLHSAGSHLASTFASLLQSTVYHEIAGQFHGASMEVEEMVCAEARRVVKEAEEDMRSEGCTGEAAHGQPPPQTQVVAKTMAKILQTQLHCFQLASDHLSMVSMLPRPDSFDQSHDSGCIISQSQESQGQVTQSQGSNCLTSQLQDSKGQTSQSQDSKGQTSQSLKDLANEKLTSSKVTGSPVRTKKSFSSLFSKFGSQKSSFPTQSAFYVNLEEEEVQKKAELEPGEGDEASGVTAAGQLSQPQSQPGVEGPSDNAGHHVSGHIASQDDLDLVIKMLSGCSSGCKPFAMDSIPEHPSSASTPHHQLHQASSSKAVGSHLHNKSDPAPHHPPYKSGGINGGQMFQHRQSDGFLCQHLPREVAGNKTNTWPFKPGLGGGGSDISRMLQHYSSQEGAGVGEDGLSPRYWGSASGGSRAGDVQQGYWTGGMGETQRWSQATGDMSGCGDVGGKPWPQVVDSSSCSDESSSNGGEVPWMIGQLHPTGHSQRRRHSSGGDEMGLMSAPSILLNKSMESLLESKMTNTWPPKHPWGTSEDAASVADMAAAERGCSTLPPPPPSLASALHQQPPVPHMKSAVHRPLSNQWSDPLATNRITMWDPGMNASVSQQNFIRLPAGVAPDTILDVSQTAEHKY